MLIILKEQMVRGHSRKGREDGHSACGHSKDSEKHHKIDLEKDKLRETRGEYLDTLSIEGVEVKKWSLCVKHSVSNCKMGKDKKKKKDKVSAAATRRIEIESIALMDGFFGFSVPTLVYLS